MSAGTITQGRRRPDAEYFKLGDWQPGDYGKLESDGEVDWMIMNPAGQLGSLGNHQIEEHPDGTITVTPSILDLAPGGWHGYLTKGCFIEV